MKYICTWEGKKFTVQFKPKGPFQPLVQCPKCGKHHAYKPDATKPVVRNGKLSIVSNGGAHSLICREPGCGWHVYLTDGVAVSI